LLGAIEEAIVARQAPRSFLFQIPFYDSEMRDIARQPIHVIDQNCIEDCVLRIITYA
jgi:hypothetical protein